MFLPSLASIVQVFSVLESTYQHDSLRYLLDYFVPAKHLLHKLQQHACVSSKLQTLFEWNTHKAEYLETESAITHKKYSLRNLPASFLIPLKWSLGHFSGNLLIGTDNLRQSSRSSQSEQCLVKFSYAE